LSHTIVGTRHPSLAHYLSLADGELILVNAFISKESWYAFTTRRIVSRFQGSQQQMEPSPRIVGDFPNFKGYALQSIDPLSIFGDTPNFHEGTSGDFDKIDKGSVVARDIATIRDPSCVAELRFQYETGEAAMAPMYAVRYWQDKHPILHKLMTTAEREEYRIRNSLRK